MGKDTTSGATAAPVPYNIFTNRDGNTLIKEFEGVLRHNTNIKRLDAVVGFLRASGYFTLRPFLDNINKGRVLIGIDVDKYIARSASLGQLFYGTEGEVKDDCRQLLRQDIESARYTKEVEDGILRMVDDLAAGRLYLPLDALLDGGEHHPRGGAGEGAARAGLPHENAPLFSTPKNPMCHF